MKPIRVMLVDDNPDYRELVRTALKQDGRAEVVSEAQDGADAVFKAIEAKPEVVLLDLSMPVMDGLEALGGLKGAVPGCKIVVCSAFEATFGEDAVNLGADDRIRKGASLADLVEKIVSVAGTELEQQAVAGDPDWISRYLIAVLARDPVAEEEQP